MRKRTGQCGYFLSEYALALYVFMLILPLLVCIIGMFPVCFTFPDFVQDQIGIAQLRRILALSYDIQPEGDSLVFTYQEKEWNLYLHDQELLLQPGTQYILIRIDDASFYRKGKSIYLAYERKNETYEVVLCQA